MADQVRLGDDLVRMMSLQLHLRKITRILFEFLPIMNEAVRPQAPSNPVRIE